MKNPKRMTENELHEYVAEIEGHGSQVTGTFGTTTLWDNIGTGYISDAYVNTGSDGQVAPNCP